MKRASVPGRIEKPVKRISASAPLIGRHCQASVIRLLLQVVAVVGQAPFRSRFAYRCTHGSDRLESLAIGRACKRSRHLRLHPDLVHNRDIFPTVLPISKSSFQQDRIGNRCRSTTFDAGLRPVYGPPPLSRACDLSFSLIGCPRLSMNTIDPNEPPASEPPHTGHIAHPDRRPSRFVPDYQTRQIEIVLALNRNAQRQCGSV